MHRDPDELSRAVEALSEMYPKTFFVCGPQRLPLKHDIAGDIKTYIANNPSCELRFFNIDATVAWYCDRVGYHKASSIAGTPRLDLRVSGPEPLPRPRRGSKAKRPLPPLSASRRESASAAATNPVSAPVSPSSSAFRHSGR